MSLDQDQSLRLLADSLPPLRDALDHLCREWLPAEPPFTVTMGMLGRTLCANVATADDVAIQRIAELLETLLSDGTDAVRSGVTTGLLEALIAASATQPAALRLFKELGPMAIAYCRGWDQFTGVRTPGV
jgi:hypothetical protein